MNICSTCISSISIERTTNYKIAGEFTQARQVCLKLRQEEILLLKYEKVANSVQK